MGRLRLFSVALVMWSFAGAAVAQPPAGDCAIGAGLGATLLFPYFELDLANPQNVTTLISIANGLDTPTLTRVVVWSDWGVPTIAFDVFLDAFAVQSINVRDVFNGILPSTGAGADLSGFDWCDDFPPFHANPALSSSERAQLAADHTGVEGPISPTCVGSPHPDQIARGYVTVDVVDECSGVEGFAPVYTPANTDYPYFADSDDSGIATNQNRLWGDVLYVDTGNAAAQGSEAISLWADPTLLTGGDIYTFYGRLSGWDGRDHRVPVPRSWNQRFLNGGAFGGGADLIVWRDTPTPPAYVTCGETPPWYPLSTTANHAVEESGENIVDFGSDRFPAATQRVSVSTLAIPYSFGWAQIGTASSQIWVQPTLRASGLFSASWNGTPIHFNCGPHS